jgi:preprotein translocase subunit SecE
MNSIKSFISSSFSRLTDKQFSWPTWQELLSTTGLVITASVVIALVVLFMDGTINFLFSNLIYR